MNFSLLGKIKLGIFFFPQRKASRNKQKQREKQLEGCEDKLS